MTGLGACSLTAVREELGKSSRDVLNSSGCAQSVRGQEGAEMLPGFLQDL